MAGNANSGRGRDKPFALALRMEIAEAGENPRALRNIARALIAKAEEGDMAAIKEFADRLDGKPAQESTVTIDDKRDATDWTRDELVAFLSNAAADSVGTPEKGRRGRKPGNVH